MAHSHTARRTDAEAAFARTFVRLGRAALVLSAIGILGACTIVRVGDGANMRTRYYPGIAVVRVAAGASAQVIDVRSAGLSVVGNQFSLGWLDSRTALVPPGRCHLILLRANAPAVAELREHLGPRTDLCTEEGEQ